MNEGDMLTNQEVFNIAVEGIFKQGGPSYAVIDGEAYCRYRLKNGRKCVAGLILPDEDYHPNMEDNVCGDLGWFRENVENINFLERLQEIHDGSATGVARNEICSDEEFFKRWIPKMIKIANNYELDIPQLLHGK